MFLGMSKMLGGVAVVGWGSTAGVGSPTTGGSPAVSPGSEVLPVPPGFSGPATATPDPAPATSSAAMSALIESVTRSIGFGPTPPVSAETEVSAGQDVRPLSHRICPAREELIPRRRTPAAGGGPASGAAIGFGHDVRGHVARS